MLNHVLFRNDDGASAVEFALVAPMVIALMFATIEIGAMEMMSGNLDASIISAARMIRVGDPNRATSEAAFANQVCANIADSSANCAARLAVSVVTYPTFAAVGQAATSTPDGTFDVSSAGQIVLVKATYTWPLVLPLYLGGFKTTGANQAVLSTSTIFKTEPYQ